MTQPAQSAQKTKHPPLNRQPRRYLSSDARQAAEQERRQELQAAINWQIKTPLAGCAALSPKERKKIRDNIRHAKIAASDQFD